MLANSIARKMGRVNFLTNCKSALKGSVKKWKFKMALAMKGGDLAYHLGILMRKKFFKNHLESLPDCQNVYCT